MQVKTTMKYHIIPIWMVTINKTESKKCWWPCGKLERLCAIHRNVKWYSHCGKVYGDSLKIKLPYDPAIPPMLYTQKN